MICYTNNNQLQFEFYDGTAGKPNEYDCYQIISLRIIRNIAELYVVS